MKDKTIFIHTALDCVVHIEEYIRDLSLDDFLNDRKTQDAVIRNLEVIGQTIKDFGSDDLAADYPEISWHQIAGMRNIIAHEYLGIDLVLVWETITNHFSSLKIVLEKIVLKGKT
jgi:uncharacterized protein with HEPN domain